MQNKILILIFICVSVCLAQNQIEFFFLNDSTTFDFNIIKSDFEIGDSIKIEFKLKNKSDKNFFIFANDPYKNEPQFDGETNEISYIHGGFLSLEFGLVNSMRIIHPGDTISYNLSFSTELIFKENKYNRIRSYKFFIYFGYLDFDENLEYLTKTKENLVQLENNRDASKIVTLHHEVLLGYLPINIKEK